MTFIEFLLPAFVSACIFIAGIASAAQGSFFLVDGRGWKDKVLGLIMVIIPFTLLIATCMYGTYQEKMEKQQQNQVEVNRQ